MLPAFQTDDDSNFTDPPTRAKVFMATILPLYALTLVIVGARFLVKTKLNKLGVDDLLIGISMVRLPAVKSRARARTDPDRPWRWPFWGAR